MDSKDTKDNGEEYGWEREREREREKKTYRQRIIRYLLQGKRHIKPIFL